MESGLAPFWTLTLTTFITMFWEVVRFKCFLALDLGFAGRGGHRYPYYVDYSMSLPLVAPMFSMGAVVVSTRIWRVLLVLPPPWNPYVAGVSLLFLFCIIAGLLYVARGKLKRMADDDQDEYKIADGGVDEEKKAFERSELVRILLLAGVLAFCFICQPLRPVFAGTLFFIVSLAVGKTLSVINWPDLVTWVKRTREEAQRKAARACRGEERALEADAEGAPAAVERGALLPPSSVRLRFFFESETKITTDGEALQIDGEEIIVGDNHRAAELAKRLQQLPPLEGFQYWLVDFVNAQSRIDQQKNLLEEIPRVIAQNWHKLPIQQKGMRKQALEKKLQAAIRELLDQTFGERMTSLLYWNYYLEQDEVHFSLTRTPNPILKPVITIQEYLGIPLTYYEQRLRKRKKR